MNRVLAIFLSVLLTACSSGEPVAAKRNESCIPESYRIHAPDWIPNSSNITNSGVAFRGCWNSDVKGCELPRVIFTGGISWDKIPETSFGRMPVDAPYRQMALEREAIVDPNTKMISISADGNWHRWLIWNAPTGKINDDAQLLAACEDRKVLVQGKYEGAIFCKRVVSGLGYYVDYTFISPDKIPRGIEQIDRRLVEVLNSWGCSANHKN